MDTRASRWTQFSKSRPFRYGLAVVVTGVALLLRQVLDPYLGNYTPFITMFPTVAVLAAYVGIGPSALSVVLGLLGVTYWFVPPRHSFAVWEHPVYLIAAVVYLIFGVVMVLGGEWSRRSRVKLRRTRVLFETFLDNSPGAEYLKDESGTYVYANRTNKARFVSDFIGKTDFEIFPKATAQQFREHDLAVLRDNKAQEFIEQTDEADGLHTWLTVKFPVIDADGKRLIGGKSIDITEKQLAEAQLHKVEKLAAAGQLAASLAHEINNPLSSVINALYLLKNQAALDEHSRYLVNTAGTELQRVARIVKQSLSYYREGSSQQLVDLAALTEESLQVFSEKIRHAGVTVTKKLTPGTSMIGFADEVRQVIDNLLLNALEASADGGRLIVCVRPSHDWRNRSATGSRLIIADTGSGIPKESMARVFEPFFTTKPEKGTGLGLWVVRGMLAKHGGGIKIRSRRYESKSGTVVSIFWPMGKLAGQGDELARAETTG
jgi:signal transduction histidine kinase